MKFELPRSLRLLPVVCLAAAGLLCLKLVSIGTAIGAAPESKAPAQAQTQAAPPPSAAPAPAPARMASVTTPPVEVPAVNPPRRDGTGGGSEIDVLQLLSERRAEIDRRADEVQQREILLKATEQRINEKIARLEAIQKGIGDEAKKQDDQEEAKLRSLVKIYETMKPKEAARIMEQLELPVLLQVLQRMKEPKSAPILAAMDAGKAKTASAALVEKKPPPQVKPAASN